MINITKHKHTTIHYECDCGARGMCSYKPVNREAAIVIDLRCPACQETERVTMLQYSDEKNRKEILENFDTIDLSWTPSFNEEIEGD